MLDILINIINSIILLSFIMVVLVNNTLYSVFFLIFGFINTAILLLILNLEFLSLALILIYVGAIAVLFLFVIIMLDLKKTTTKISISQIISTLSILLYLTIIVIYFYLSSIVYPTIKPTIIYMDFFALFNQLSELEMYGQLLYTHFCVDFIIVGFILFIAMMGPIVLTLKKNNYKKQELYIQKSKNKNNSVYSIK